MGDNVYKNKGYGFDSSINATYGVSESYGESFLGMDYRIPARDFGFPSDPRTANQLQAVSQKISTGAKTIEVSGVSLSGGGAMKLMDTIPKQQFQEINRLKKLAGVDLTFHGPLVEPTGVSRQGWTEEDRKHSERQMISAVRRGHELDPKGNLVVTFHSSNGLPDPQTVIINDKGEKEIKDFWVIDEYKGQFSNEAPRLSHFTKEEKLPEPKDILEKKNADTWFGTLESINFNIRRGAEVIDQIKELDKGQSLFKLYGKLGTQEGQNLLKELEKEGIKKDYAGKMMNEITFGDLNLRQGYQQFQEIYDRTYEAAKKSKSESDLKKLNDFRDEMASKFGELKKKENVSMLADELRKGIQVLRTIETPQIFRPLRDWAIEEGGKTFANVAFDSYKKFKNSSPIISIENPPVGMGLSKAEDLRDLVKEAQEQFIERAMKDLKMSRHEAKTQAEKLIGVTWDVGHINMLRGHGYEEKHLLEQTKKIAPFVKHVHLSDNFGMEHTELPMGMGNVPTKKMLDLIHGYNKKVKKIVETGDWFEPFKSTPFKETLNAFGSPVYGAEGQYWNQIANTQGGYFSGQGAVNPPIHHSIWGSGFSNLPVELGGQMAGRSRVSGAPIE